MGLSRAEQDAILAQDKARRAAKLLADVDHWLAAQDDSPRYSRKRGAWANPELVRGIGIATSREARVTERYAMRAGTKKWSDVTARDAITPTWALRPMPTVGHAPGANPADGPSMLVTKNGESRVVSLKKDRAPKRTRTRAHAADAPSAASLPSIRAGESY